MRCDRDPGRPPPQEARRGHRAKPVRHSRCGPRSRAALNGDPLIDATLACVGSTLGDDGTDRAASYAVGSATLTASDFVSCVPMPRRAGAVFVALDTELHREVAIKQILDPTRMTRSVGPVSA